jgi:hypothetical protein
VRLGGATPALPYTGLNLNTLDWVEEPTMYWQCATGQRQTFLDARLERRAFN